MPNNLSTVPEQFPLHVASSKKWFLNFVAVNILWEHQSVKQSDGNTQMKIHVPVHWRIEGNCKKL